MTALLIIMHNRAMTKCISIYFNHSNTQIDTINNACGCYFFVRGVRTSRSFCVLNHSFDVVIIVGNITKLVSNCH